VTLTHFSSLTPFIIKLKAPAYMGELFAIRDLLYREVYRNYPDWLWDYNANPSLIHNL